MARKEFLGVILDTETSGKGPGAVVIEAARMEISATPLEFMRLKPEDAYMDGKLYGLPDGLDMELGAMAVHGITPEQLEGLEPFKGFEYHGKYVIGHKVDFDVEITGYHGAQRICTLALSRFLWPHLDSHTQSAVLLHIAQMTRKGYQWAIDLSKNAHRATDDVLNCSRVLKMIIYVMSRTESLKHHVESWDALVNLSLEAQIPKVMRFGKFKDQPIEAVDQSWIDWLYAQPGEQCRYLTSAFRRAGKTVPENA